MKNFRDYINEEMMPYAQTEKGFVGVDNGPVRDNINLFLASVTERPHATPYHALEVIRKVLAPFHIHPPATNFLDGDEGHEIFQINQFGEKVGMTNSGDVVTKDSSPYFLYFEYSMNSRGSFDIFSEIVNQEELDEILADIEDEIEDDTTTGDGRDAEDSFDVYRAGNKGREEIRESEEKTMPSWYAKQPGKAHREALRKEKKKEQDKKIKYAIRRLKEEEEQLDELSIKTMKSAKEKLADKAVGAHYDDNKAAARSYAARALKIGSKIKRREWQEKYGKKATNEEHLDELSKDFVANVAKAAIADSNRGTGRNQGGPTAGERWHNKRRQKLAGKAIDKLSGNAKVLAKEEQLDEISKKKLGDYVKKASHDVAARSAAVRGFARDADDQRKDKKAMDARRSDERADKMFKKSWNRRKYMAKAVDKLTTEAQSADTHTGALTYKGKPVVSPTATTAQPEFPPKNVPVPKPRPKNLEEDKKKENKIQHHQTSIDALRDKIDKRIKSGDRGIGGYGYNDSDEKELAYHKKQLRKLKLSEEQIDEALPLQYFARPLPKDSASGKFNDVVKNAMKNARKATKEIIKKKKS